MEYLKLNIQLFGAFAEKENTSLVSKSGPNKGRVYAKFTEANPTADDISKNQTRITPYGEYSQGGSYSGYNTPKLVLTWYDDNEHKNGLLLGTTPATSYANKEKIKVEPKEFAVKHKDDGTLNGYLKAEWIWTGSGYCCNSGSAVTSNTALTSIPRAKTISALSADIGYDTLITLKQTSASYTTTITYECGELSGTIEEKTSETSIGWKIPTEIYSQLLPTDKEIDVKLTATTYSGDTQIGSPQTTTLKARVNEEDNRPLAYLDVEDVNEITTALTSDPNKVVLNASSIKCNVQGMSKNGAIIKSMTINGIQLVDFAYRTPDEGTPEDITEIALDEFTIEKPTTNVFTLIVTDSRGNTNNITVDNQRTLEKIDYIIPTISATFKRNTPVDGLVNVRYDGKFFNDSFKEGTSNVLSMAYQYRDKESDSEDYSEWIPLTVTTSETDNTYGGQLQLEELFNYEKRFDFRLSVKDLVNDYGVVFTTGSIAKGKPSHWYDDENFYVEGGYYQRNKETGKWFKPIGNLTDLETDDKGSVVRAINSLCSKKGDFISVYRSSDYKLTATNTYTTIPFNITFQSRGSSLTLQSDGGIKIGAGVNTIAINGQFYFYTGTIGFKAVQIQKNSQTISRTTYQNVDQYTMINACRQIANVSEGDIIYLQANGSSNDVIKAYQHSTFMCVEVIA